MSRCGTRLQALQALVFTSFTPRRLHRPWFYLPVHLACSSWEKPEARMAATDPYGSNGSGSFVFVTVGTSLVHFRVAQKTAKSQIDQLEYFFKGHSAAFRQVSDRKRLCNPGECGNTWLLLRHCDPQTETWNGSWGTTTAKTSGEVDFMMQNNTSRHPTHFKLSNHFTKRYKKTFRKGFFKRRHIKKDSFVMPCGFLSGSLSRMLSTTAHIQRCLESLQYCTCLCHENRAEISVSAKSSLVLLFESYAKLLCLSFRPLCLRLTRLCSKAHWYDMCESKHTCDEATLHIPSWKRHAAKLNLTTYLRVHILWLEYSYII